ncbi:hypothetical protein PbB2_00145 [Candidatus Phycosocius bacilliformis]|uniref:HPt domain-containing protein n=2 Tax=Candidatus Phycosocius bacilliformis TaxID=1445552 RepID=A0A2P2E607_9PROT|nr:hypothetical protein PbB2_00145 [Candidatus Phycosocius bacilliformis]
MMRLDITKPDLSTLKSTYLSSLAVDQDRITGLLSELTYGLAEPRTYKELHRIAHAQAGNAATFGFERLGDAARTINQRLNQAHELSAELEAEVIAWLGELQQICRSYR